MYEKYVIIASLIIVSIFISPVIGGDVDKYNSKNESTNTTNMSTNISENGEIMKYYRFAILSTTMILAIAYFFNRRNDIKNKNKIMHYTLKIMLILGIILSMISFIPILAYDQSITESTSTVHPNMFLNSTTESISTAHPNMFLNSSEIDIIKQRINNNQEPWKTAYNKLITDANNALNVSIQSVTYGGPTPPTGDVHDYYTELPYSSDGVYNPNADRTDYYAAMKVKNAVRDLGLAYVLTEDSRYANKAMQFINAWVIDPSTKMNPKYLNNDSSKIELSITIPAMFYGADLIWNYPGWNDADKDVFKQWTQQFIDSAKTWSRGDNYENWRLVLISSAAIITENSDDLTYSYNRWRRLISSQIDSEGKIITELNRTRSFYYSLYGIDSLMQVAEIARHNGIDLYNYKTSDGIGLELALDFHAPYASGTEPWPYEEIRWDLIDYSLYELAYSFKQKSSYSDVITVRGRPMYETRIMGPVTLTHANSYFNIQ